MLASDDAILGGLPLPLAQLTLRARNCKTPVERYLAGYYLWEASLKLLASTAIVEYARLDDHDEAVEERLHSLARPSTGHWLEYTRLLVPILAERCEQFAAINDLLFGKRRDDLPRASGLHGLLKELSTGKASPQSTVRLSELFDSLVAFRNRELGHGAAGQQSEEHYEKLGRVLLLGMGEILQHLDVLAGRTLVFVSEVRRGRDADWQLERFALRGETTRRLDPLSIKDQSVDTLPSPEQVYLQSPQEDAPDLSSVHPLVIYEPETSEVFFLNGRRGRRQADYLCYTTGNVVRREGLERTQRELLSRVLGIEVDESAIEAWTESDSTSETAPSEPDPDSTRTIGEFELLTRIGAGGMGEVYRARQPSLGREVALKRLIRSGDPKSEARFAREIRALGQVEHPNLVKIFTAGTCGDQWFYVMELIDGADLESICGFLSHETPQTVDGAKLQRALTTSFSVARKNEKPVTKDASAEPPTETEINSAEMAATEAFHGDLSQNHLHAVVQYGRQVAAAAHALHEAGVVHRDIKPGNIMIDRFGKAVLMDLGLAKFGQDAEGKLTETRQFVGTLCYASPEQVISAGTIDRRSDVYSIGATLWEMLTLRRPFVGDQESSTYELMFQIQQEDPQPIRKFNPDVPADLEAIILKCMEKKPSDRYQTAADLEADLTRFADRETVHARSVGPIKKFIKRCQRRPAVTGSVLAVLILFACGVGYGVHRLALKDREKTAHAAQLKKDREKRDSNLSSLRSLIRKNRGTGVHSATQWEVAIETWPGPNQTWWFSNGPTARRLLPVVRHELASAGVETFDDLFDSATSSAFLAQLFKNHKVLSAPAVRVTANKPVPGQAVSVDDQIAELRTQVQDAEEYNRSLQPGATESVREKLLRQEKQIADLKPKVEAWEQSSDPSGLLKTARASEQALMDATDYYSTLAREANEREHYAATCHTMALVQLQLAQLHQQIAQKDTDVGTAKAAWEQASACIDKSAEYFARAVDPESGYSEQMPLAALCELDRVHFDDHHARFLRTYAAFLKDQSPTSATTADTLLTDSAELDRGLPTRLMAINDRLSKSPWESSAAFVSLRLVALLREAALARALARQPDTKPEDAQRHFAQAEKQYAAARDAARKLADQHPDIRVLREHYVKARVYLGLVFLDQWKFDSAKREFREVKDTLDQPSLTGSLSECKSREEFEARLEYIRVMHRIAMCQCYSDSLNPARTRFENIITEMDNFLAQENIDTDQRKTILRQRANSLERCAECVEDLSGKQQRLKKAVDSFANEDEPAAPSVVCKYAITLALSDKVDDAVRVLQQHKTALGSGATLVKVAQTVSQLSGKERAAAIANLRAIAKADTDGRRNSDREGIVTRMLAWQLIRTNATEAEKTDDEKKDPDSLFKHIKASVPQEAKGWFGLQALDTYRDQVSKH